MSDLAHWWLQGESHQFASLTENQTFSLLLFFFFPEFIFSESIELHHLTPWLHDFWNSRKVAVGDHSQEQGMVERTLLACSTMLDRFRPSGKPCFRSEMEPPEALQTLVIETGFRGGGDVSLYSPHIVGTLKKIFCFLGKCSFQQILSTSTSSKDRNVMHILNYWSTSELQIPALKKSQNMIRAYAKRSIINGLPFFT